MYRSCLYCGGGLGRNTLIEALPVGRRLAFDPVRGRLWIVCPGCVKWNLVPFDTRLEAIDACERQFRSTATRYSTDNIGLARHGARVDLIRIGRALRPEFASWRYGAALRRRRKQQRRAHADPFGALNWLLTTLLSEPLASLPLRDVTNGAIRALYQHCPLRDPWTDRLVDVPYAALMQASLIAETTGRWRLEIPYRTGAEHRLGGRDAALASIRDVPSLGLFRDDALLPTLGRLLPALDTHTPAEGQVTEAVRLVDTAADGMRLFEYVVGRPMRHATQRQYPLREVAPEIRLAIEMAAHEDTERRAMEGELKLLERQWRDADALARIADALALEA